MKSSVAAVTTVAVAALALAGCAGEGTITEAPVIERAQKTNSEPTAPEAQPKETIDSEESGEPTDAFRPETTFSSTQVGAATDSASFGDTIAWDDGISISISEPKPYEPSDTAAGSEGFDSAAKFSVTVTNDTDEDFSLLFVFIEVTSGGAESSQIFDYGQGLELSYDDVAAGKEVEFDQAYGVEDPGDVLVTVTPDLFYDEVEFSD